MLLHIVYSEGSRHNKSRQKSSSTYSTITASQVDKNATYYIIADSWTALYAWAKCTAIELYDETTFARDLLADYIRAGGLE